LFGCKLIRDNENIRPTKCLNLALERPMRELPWVGNTCNAIKMMELHGYVKTYPRACAMEPWKEQQIDVYIKKMGLRKKTIPQFR